MKRTLLEIRSRFRHPVNFGSTQWVSWVEEDDGSWTATFQGRSSGGHRPPVRVGDHNGTAAGDFVGLVVSICPSYEGGGEWAWSQHLAWPVGALDPDEARKLMAKADALIKEHG